MTEFFCFKSPISSVKPEKVGGHVHLRVFMRGALSGTLIVREDEVSEMLNLFRESNPAVARSGGCPGTSLAWYGSFADDVWLVSEYGEVLQVRDLK